MLDTRTMAPRMKRALTCLMQIKDSDVRMMTLDQALSSADKGLHIGGAFSAVVPLTAMYYGGFLKADVENPTATGQDQFVLSKGHAVASMASVYADLGYYSTEVLTDSRSMESILNGHPGPILPGVQVSTGPLGQGVAVAQGFAMVGKNAPSFDVFTMMGDGEIQEGIAWEAFMYAPSQRLDNLCVIIDHNHGQLDDPKALVLSLGALKNKMEAFGWRVIEADGTQYATMLDAFSEFKYGARDGRPTVIISDSIKGNGGFSDFANKHKVNVTAEYVNQESGLQSRRRDKRVADFLQAYQALDDSDKSVIDACAQQMNLRIDAAKAEVAAVKPEVKTKPAPKRDKAIRYDADRLPKLDSGKTYAASDIIRDTMKVLAMDERIMSVDSDLSSTSGLQPGVASVDVHRGLNVGIAEANMMNIAEAYAVLGYNAWVSTFCPFFDWKVMRRIAVGLQERNEVIEQGNGWLSSGHSLDITFVATAPNFETATNGATHMGNDDIMVFSDIAQVKIIDVGCPQLLKSVLQWIAQGNRGLVYLRVLRAAAAVLHPADRVFEYGKGYLMREGSRATIISSGRGVHEAVQATNLLQEQGLAVAVVDMPSADERMMVQLYEQGAPLIIAEQNNGYLYRKLQEALFKAGVTIDPKRIHALNLLDRNGQPQFVHSGTYAQLVAKFGLDAASLAKTVQGILA